MRLLEEATPQYHNPEACGLTSGEGFKPQTGTRFESTYLDLARPCGGRLFSSTGELCQVGSLGYSLGYFRPTPALPRNYPGNTPAIPISPTHIPPITRSLSYEFPVRFFREHQRRTAPAALAFQARYVDQGLRLLVERRDAAAGFAADDCGAGAEGHAYLTLR